MKKSSTKIDRRNFFKQTATVTAASTVLNTLPENNSVHASETGKKPQLPSFIIDSHLHCKGTKEWVEDVVKIYRPYNAMACALTWIDDLELMVDAMKSYPDVFRYIMPVFPTNKNSGSAFG